MFSIAVLALLLGVGSAIARRRIRLGRLAAMHLAAARNLQCSDPEGFVFGSAGDEARAYNLAMSAYYRDGRRSWWLPLPDEPVQPTEPMRAFLRAYDGLVRLHPALDLEEYRTDIYPQKIDEPRDRVPWVVSLRKKDNTSGMYIYLGGEARIQTWDHRRGQPIYQLERGAPTSVLATSD